MKFGAIKLFVTILSLSFGFLQVHAQEKASPSGVQDKTQRSHNFEDLLVQGKYHFATDSVTTVEADKVFDTLIGVRSDFKDRLEESASKK